MIDSRKWENDGSICTLKRNNSPRGHRLSSSVTMSSLFMRWSLNSFIESDSGNRPEIPAMTMSSWTSHFGILFKLSWHTCTDEHFSGAWFDICTVGRWYSSSSSVVKSGFSSEFAGIFAVREKHWKEEKGKWYYKEDSGACWKRSIFAYQSSINSI